VNFRPVIYCLIICFLTPVILRAQNNTTPTRAELEKRKQELQNELQEANEALQSVQQNRKLTVRQVQLLQNKLNIRNKLIENTNDEISLINGDINRAYHDISTLENDLDTLKVQYAKQVVYAYKTRSSYDYLNFILSANSFNDAIKRFEYLKQYRDYRKHQASSIVETENLLKEKIAYLSSQKTDRREALTGEIKQRQILEQERQEKNNIVESLKGREKELMADIIEKRRAQQKLNATISILIRKEIEEARERAEAESKAAANKTNNTSNSPANNTITKNEPSSVPANNTANNTSSAESVLEFTPEDKLISQNFEGNKGKLPWPVAKGFISDPYGRHQHPVLEHVEVQNYGVNIDTDKGAEARAVFNGEVATVSFDQYNKWTIIIRHGQYFTVYSNLLKSLVKEGDQVSTKQPIGIVYTNSATDETYIHFFIYKGTDSVNPALWLSSSH
jgi:murein hydrolase activator